VTGPVIQNFRGARALIVHRDDANRETLALTLRRLGLLVAAIEPGTPSPAAAMDACDLVFFDADDGLGGVFGEAPPPDAAYVALIGVEAPGRLARVVRQRCCGYLMKPIRASGVFTALFLSANEFAQRKREARERAALAERMAGRRVVTKAILALVASQGVDDEEAYRRLRRDSMRRRLPVAAIAREILGETPPEAGRDAEGRPDSLRA
jgi:AmiR/NasT family two-component response regulator